MNILILGGTRFVGRSIAEALLAAGHQVSVFTRGQSPDALPAHVERLCGDRDTGSAGLQALKGRSYDACVDVSGYTPRQVRASATALRDCVGRYLFISAVSVYGDPQSGPVRETDPRLAPAGEDVTEVDGGTYGPLKVACENIAHEIFANRCTVLRPQIVAGPHDPQDRYSYWVRRAMQGGEMLAPGDGSDHLQVIAASDLGRFTQTLIERGRGGGEVFNLAGPRITWTEFMGVLDARNVLWVPTDVIRSAGVTEFELPLFRPRSSPRSRLMDVSHEQAVAAGLTLSDPAVTVAETRAWASGSHLAPALSPEREAALIRSALLA